MSVVRETRRLLLSNKQQVMMFSRRHDSSPLVHPVLPNPTLQQTKFGSSDHLKSAPSKGRGQQRD